MRRPGCPCFFAAAQAWVTTQFVLGGRRPRQSQVVSVAEPPEPVRQRLTEWRKGTPERGSAHAREDWVPIASTSTTSSRGRWGWWSSSHTGLAMRPMRGAGFARCGRDRCPCYRTKPHAVGSVNEHDAPADWCCYPLAAGSGMRPSHDSGSASGVAALISLHSRSDIHMQEFMVRWNHLLQASGSPHRRG